MNDWDQLRDLLNGILFALIAGLGGGVAYLSSIVGNRKKKFIFADFIIKAISSAFAGLLIGWILAYYQYPLTIICSVTGTAGYLGADFTVNLLKRVCLKDIEDSNNSNKGADD